MPFHQPIPSRTRCGSSQTFHDCVGWHDEQESRKSPTQNKFIKLNNSPSQQFFRLINVGLESRHNPEVQAVTKFQGSDRVQTRSETKLTTAIIQPPPISNPDTIKEVSPSVVMWEIQGKKRFLNLI